MYIDITSHECRLSKYIGQHTLVYYANILIKAKQIKMWNNLGYEYSPQMKIIDKAAG